MRRPWGENRNLIGQWVEVVWNSPMPGVPEWLHRTEGELLEVDEDWVTLREDRDDGMPLQRYTRGSIESTEPKKKEAKVAAER